MITMMIGLVTAGCFFGMGLLHAYWALGGRSGSPSVIPTQDGKLSFTPTPALTWLVALGLFLGALIVVGALGFRPAGLPSWLFTVGVWGLATLFLLRAIGDFHWVGFFKTVRHTPFAYYDNYLYSPLCVGLALACALIGASA